MLQPASSLPLIAPEEATFVRVTAPANVTAAPNPEVQAIQATTAVAATSAAAQSDYSGQQQSSISVVVPQGVEAGRQVQFTTPEGQRLVVTVQERVQPGGCVKVSYTPPAANLRSVLPSAEVTYDAQDKKASQCGWIAYLTSLVCCFCCTPCAMCLSPITWCFVSARYFCQPSQVRKRYPQLRQPALMSLITLFLVTGVGCLGLAGLIGFVAGYGEAGGDWSLLLPAGPADWANFTKTCPKWGSWGKEHCPHGPFSCDRKPNQKEMSMICAEAQEAACHWTAKRVDVLKYIEKPCSSEKADWKKVDWTPFVKNCPKWSSWGKEHCPHGPRSCDRPSREEFAMICDEAKEDACHAAAVEVTDMTRAMVKRCAMRPNSHHYKGPERKPALPPKPTEEALRALKYTKATIQALHGNPPAARVEKADVSV
jgi:hypothetical protein